MPSSEARPSVGWIPLAVLAAALILLYLLWHVLLIFILAAFFAFLVYPAVRLFGRRLSHVFSIISVYLILLIILTTVIGLLAPVVVRQFNQFVENAPSYAQRARELSGNIQERYVALPSTWRSLGDRVLAGLQQTASRITRDIIPQIISFFGSLFTYILFIPLLAFFMLLDYAGYKRMITAIVPPQHRITVDDLSTCMGNMMRGFLKGQFTLMLVVGLANGLGLYIVGMPYAAVLGVVAGLLELIPTVGPTITTILVVSIGLVIEPILGLRAGIVTISVQLLENTFLVPLVMRRAVGLDPVTIAFSIFLGGSVAGIAGAIIAIPIALIIKIVILYFYVDDSVLPRVKELYAIHPAGEGLLAEDEPVRYQRKENYTDNKGLSLMITE